eukprot:CAMPEP_0176007594 /NCGR_PEP_ID=MMETSP0120_2-20121206/3313_1 /TAXON_ID=160619 /ORGANISM="Kryptoperidinium foliaceum, Strain CCMP 1326" /LENGTH=944 /DNA_ID=CAMNT_0017340359 /DNA_START=101 /DNA_END=2932 /DNA_ORIENTATION=-
MAKEALAGRLQRGFLLAFAAGAIGVLTTLSAVVIELASDFFADFRHGICVERVPGDTRPLWQATFGGGWRPYDRMRCCGGSGSVDLATQECRANSIIQHVTRKRLANPVRGIGHFGAAVPMPLGLVAAASRETFGAAGASTEIMRGEMLQERHEERRSGIAADEDSSGLRGGSGRSQRASHVTEAVSADAAAVRAHMSHLFGPDPTENWADEFPHEAVIPEAFRPIASLTEEVAEVAVNDGAVQTRTESAGSLAPTFEWVPWERVWSSRPAASVLIYVAGTGFFALLASLVTRHRPASRGSGIPEVKAAVAGFALPNSFRPETLLAKVLALSLCVGAGLAVGKEGPMIHIGACWGVLLAGPLSRLGQRYDGLPIDPMDLVCVGAAAGVSSAFGAPLAGVLFAVEELGTTMPTGLRYSTMLCAFGSAVTAAMTMKWLDLARTQRLTLFEVDYRQAWAPWEAIPFCLLGVLGGIFGGLFVLANEAVHRRRLRAEAEGSACWYFPSFITVGSGGGGGGSPAAGGYIRRGASQAAAMAWTLRIDGRVLEVVVLAVFTGLSNYPHLITRILMNDSIKALFLQCAEVPGAAALAPRDPLGFCGAHDTIPQLIGLIALLLGASLLRFAQTVVTVGALTPAGLFVPSLFIGGCFGRALGGVLKFAGMVGAGGALEPGIYAMVGAGAMLAGVSRLTLSLAVVLFELTGGLTYIVPFMMAVLIGKWTGDLVTDGRSIYDVHGELKGFTKVEPPEDVRLLNATLDDLLESSSEAETLAAAAGLRGAGDIEARQSVAAAACTPPVLWVQGSGRPPLGVLAEHARHAGLEGFAVVSVDAAGESEIMGWCDTERVLATCCGGASPASAKMPWVMLAGKQEQQVAQLIDRQAVVQLRSGCPLQTAYCVFEQSTHVRAVLTFDDVSRQYRTVTRELFRARLSHGCLRPQGSAQVLGHKVA